jgi:hypothetical protein
MNENPHLLVRGCLPVGMGEINYSTNKSIVTGKLPGLIWL